MYEYQYRFPLIYVVESISQSVYSRHSGSRVHPRRQALVEEIFLHSSRIWTLLLNKGLPKGTYECLTCGSLVRWFGSQTRDLRV